MFDHFRQRQHKRWFNLRCAAIDRTPPVRCNPDSDVVIVSQVYPPDTTMLLLAAKSFSRHLAPRGFVLVDDGLREADKARLNHHLGQVTYLPTAQAADAALPRGGTWERLATLARENAAHYVIQLDSDMLTLQPPREVLDCVAQRRSFTLGTSSGTRPVPVQTASDYARQHDSPHVQNAAERALDQLPGAPALKYVRGCSGFTGFAPGTLSPQRIREFSTAMQGLLGTRWSEWGTEQVTSNFMAANAPDAMVLPVDRYPFWMPGADLDPVAMVHFFGTFRFQGGMYQRRALQLCRELAAG